MIGIDGTIIIARSAGAVAATKSDKWRTVNGDLKVDNRESLNRSAYGLLTPKRCISPLNNGR